MKSLKFKSELIQPILNGTKTRTWRLFDDKDLKEGDIFQVIDYSTREECGQAVITGIKEKKLGEIDNEDFEGHEKYKNQDEMIQRNKKYYGDKVNLDTIVKMIKFRLL